MMKIFIRCHGKVKFRFQSRQDSIISVSEDRKLRETRVRNYAIRQLSSIIEKDESERSFTNSDSILAQNHENYRDEQRMTKNFAG